MLANLRFQSFQIVHAAAHFADAVGHQTFAFHDDVHAKFQRFSAHGGHRRCAAAQREAVALIVAILQVDHGNTGLRGFQYLDGILAGDVCPVGVHFEDDVGVLPQLLDGQLSVQIGEKFLVMVVQSLPYNALLNSTVN